MRLTALLAIGLLLAVSWCPRAYAAGRPITHEDAWLMKRVGAPTLSPDGRWAVFSVTVPSYDPKEQVSDLWIVDTAGASAPRPLTRTKTGESGVDWSPDGRRIAFSAKREGDEVSQIYVLPVFEGGEAERITASATGARSPQWSPDGKTLLFEADAYPGAPDDEANRKAAKAVKDRKYNVRAYDGFPVRYWDHWLDGTHAHLWVQEARPGAAAKDLLAGTALVSAPGFRGSLGDSGESLSAVWMPDGRGVVFAATTDGDRAAYANVETQLFATTVSGGEPTSLTTGVDSYGDPVFSPDGAALYALVEAGGDGKDYHHTRLARFPWPFDAARRVVVTAGLDRSVTKAAPSADGTTVYLTVEDGFHVALYRVSATGGVAEALGLPGRGGLFGLRSAGDTVVASYDHAGSPPEIVRVDLAARTLVPLTRFNAEAIAALDLPEPEAFSFPGPKGWPIENRLIRPAGFDPAKKYPLLVVMHGGPAPQWKDAWGLRWNFHLLAAPGYVVLLTNYSGSTGYSEVFGQAVQLDPLRGAADEINLGADEALRRYPFLDATRQAAAGASYGGHLANWMEATTTRYRCLVSHAGLVTLGSQWGTSDSIYSREVNNGGPIWEGNPLWREQSPTAYAGNHAKGTGWVTPILLSVGEQDFRVPLNNTLEHWAYLQRLRVPSRLLVFPDANHWITKGEDSRYWFGEVHAWLAKYLKTGD